MEKIIEKAGMTVSETWKKDSFKYKRAEFALWLDCHYTPSLAYKIYCSYRTIEDFKKSSMDIVCMNSHRSPEVAKYLKANGVLLFTERTEYADGNHFYRFWVPMEIGKRIERIPGTNWYRLNDL